MAFPSVAARASARTMATDTTSHPIGLPTGIVAGNMLLVVFSVDGSPTISINTGVSGNNWTLGTKASYGTDVSGVYVWKIAEGSDALTLTTSAAEQSSHIALRITGASSVQGASATGSSTNSNPPSLTPSGGAMDYLWVATRSGDSTTVSSSPPSGYNNPQGLPGIGTSSASTNTAEKLANLSSDDPGTFTTGTEQWVSFTLAVSPVGNSSIAGTTSGTSSLAGAIRGIGRAITQAAGVALLTGLLNTSYVTIAAAGATNGAASLSASVGDVGTNYVVEGQTYVNTETGIWNGVQIPRSSPISLIFRNNSITSVNSGNYQLLAGDEEPLSSNNHLDGAIISGNRFTWNGTTGECECAQLGYNINQVVKHNYFDKTPYGVVYKSGNSVGSNMTNINGAFAYNIVKNATRGLRIKGHNGVRVYNNTFYNDLHTNIPGTLFITANTDQATPAASTGTIIKNNIFYTNSQLRNIVLYAGCESGFECDYNLYYCVAGTPIFEYQGAQKTFAQWQALGYDTHSVVVNPNFNNSTDLCPTARLNYGTSLGTTWQTGLSTGTGWTEGSFPATTDQNGTWQVGASVYGSGASALAGAASGVTSIAGAMNRSGGSIAAVANGVASLAGAIGNAYAGPTYYVSPSGSDLNTKAQAANSGTPWKSWHYAFNQLVAGDTLLVRGGTYTVMGGALNAVYISNKNGTSGSPIRVYNYPGEVPILDCGPTGGNLSGSGEHYGILISNSSFWHFKGLTVKSVREYFNGSSYVWAKGIEISSGSHDLKFERVHVTDSGNGFSFGGSTAMPNIEFLNCDAYLNWDRVDGGGYCNGFSANVPTGTTILYTGCRAWSNSDDGWDFYGGEGDMVLRNCWAWRNGYDVTTSGDGDGFKLGLSDVGTGSRTLINCVSAFNKLMGFDESADAGSLTNMYLYNCISYNNSNNAGFRFAVTAGTAYTTLRNCISYLSATGRNYEGRTRNVQDHNTWNGIPVSNADFVSIDCNQLYTDRQSNGNLPVIQFLHLKSTSGLRGQGTLINGVTLDCDGVPFLNPPSLGPYEFTTNNSRIYGASDGVASVSAIIIESGVFQGSSAGSTSVQGNITRKTHIAILSAGNTTINGNLRGRAVLLGSSTGTTLIAGTPGSKAKFQSGSAGVASVNSILIGHGRRRGSVASFASVAGVMHAKGMIAAQSAGKAALWGAINSDGIIRAAITTATTINGVIRARGRLVAITGGVATNAASIKDKRKITALSIGLSTGTGLLSAKGKLLGVTTGKSTDAGLIKAHVKLTSLSVGFATNSGRMKGKGVIAGQSSGASVVSAIRLGEGSMAAKSSGVTIDTAHLHGIGRVIANSAGISTTYARPKTKGSAIGSTVGVTIVGGKLSGKTKIKAQVIPGSSLAASLKGYGKLMAIAAGKATDKAAIRHHWHHCHVTEGVIVMTAFVCELTYEALSDVDIIGDISLGEITGNLD